MHDQNKATLAPKFIRLPDATSVYGPSRSTFDRAMKSGELTRFKPGKMVLMSIAEIESWIASKAV
jgi:predicted DNA-binding transcriptional regulator AlpA